MKYIRASRVRVRQPPCYLCQNPRFKLMWASAVCKPCYEKLEDEYYKMKDEYGLKVIREEQEYSKYEDRKDEFLVRHIIDNALQSVA